MYEGRCQIIDRQRSLVQLLAGALRGEIMLTKPVKSLLVSRSDCPGLAVIVNKKHTEITYTRVYNSTRIIYASILLPFKYVMNIIIRGT